MKILLKDKSSLVICVLLTFGILFRFSWASFVDLNVVIANQSGDSTFYVDLAKNILNYGIYGTGYDPEYIRSPLYSYFIALCSFIPGQLILNVIIIQNILSLITCISSWLLLNTCINKKILFFSILLWITSPVSYFQDALIQQESLYTNLLIIIISLTIFIAKNFKLINLIILGFLIGLTCWIREIYILLPLVITFSLFIINGRIKKSVKSLIIISLCCLLTLSPWLYRNYKISDGDIFMSKGLQGATLWVGTWLNNGNYNHQWRVTKSFPKYALEDASDKKKILNAMSNYSTLSSNQILLSEAKRVIKKNPTKVFINWIKRSYHMWIGTRSDQVPLRISNNSITWFIFKVSLWIYNLIIIILGVIGLIYYGFRKNLLLIPSTFILYNFSIYLPFYNIETRYSHPSFPWLILFMIIFICNIQFDKIYNKIYSLKIKMNSK